MLYLPTAPLLLGGNGGSIGNSVICSTAYIYGTGTAVIEYDSRFTVPAGGCYLVR